MPERYITNPSSSERGKIEAGFSKIVELSILHSHNTIIIHLPSKSQLRQLVPLLGQSSIRDLRVNNTAKWDKIIRNLIKIIITLG